jgi:hypothetical protein
MRRYLVDPRCPQRGSNKGIALASSRMMHSKVEQKMKRCSKCVLPECTPNIVFDEEGVCNYCKSYQKIQYKGESELLKILDSHRRKQSKYDCIVNISGGRDSAFTLLKLVKDYGMKTLAVNYENPFTDPQAITNIRNAVKALGVDIVRFKLKNKIHERTFRNNLNAWYQKSSPALVPIICVGCKTIWWDILRIAKKNDIHCIVSGGNLFEDVSFKKVLLGTSANEDTKTTLIKDIFGILKETTRNLAYYKLQFIPSLMKGYLFGNPYTLGSRLYGFNVTRIDLFHYIEWNEQEVLSRIKSELDWDYPRKFNSPWRFDCSVGHLKDFMYMKTIGMTEKDDFYSRMVREGKTTREDALQRLENENKLHLDEIELLLNEAGIKDMSLRSTLES